jgi:hypothetical protein
MGSMIDKLGRDLRTEFPEMWLGTLIWYYVPSDAEVKTKDWIAAVTGSVVEDMTPTKPRAVDAFKRAINKIGKASGKVSLLIDGEDVLFKFMSRDTGMDDSYVYRDLVVERLGDFKLSYGPVVKFQFNRATREVSYEVDEEVYDTMPTEVQVEVTDRYTQALVQYERERFVLGPMKIRALLREEIETRQLGVPCKPGSGIYFVFDHHQERVEGVAEVIDSLSSHGITFHQMPVADIASQREMIVKAFENETVQEVDKLMSDMADTLKGNRGKVTQAVATRYARDYSRLNSRLAEYSDLLEQKFDEQGNRLVLMQAQVIKLVEAISD